jgi:serine/threonine protein kinase/Tfp pilus assembly protein PilF
MGTSLTPGTKLGHYETLSQIGAGGMGEVYLAQDTKLARKVALKILPEDVAGDQKRMDRFSLEAQAASALNHPNILTIYEIGETDGRHFIITEFVDGVTLRERLLRRDAFLLPEALDIAMQVSGALAAAHAAGIIHRDIKPDNLMLRKDGFVKVLDFGLAKLTAPTGSEIDSEAETRTRVNTEPGVIIGTVAYMSPEQARGLQVDARTDIWSLGVVLYEMIAGQPPFAGKDVHRQIIAIQEQPAPPLSRLAEGAPERLEEIVSKTLAKSADERYQSAKDLLIDLKRLKQKLEIDAEIERTTSPDSSRSATATDWREAAITAPGVAADTVVAGTRTNSSAEYIISKIKRHKRGALIALAAVVAMAVAVVYFAYARRAEQNSPSTIRSLAVLPFVNTGNNPDTEYLSDGISESLINSLSQLPGVKVIARSSSFKYKSKDSDPQEVANALGVEAILTGRVLQRGDDLLISVELVNARDKTQLWGEQYNRKATDLLAVQSEISREIAEKLRLRLSAGERQQLTKRESVNPQAYQLYLNGLFYLRKGGFENARKALDYFNQAVALDPNFALAWVGVAKAHLGFAGNSLLDPKEALTRAKAAVKKALELDETLAEAHAVLANIKLNAWDWAGAEREYKRAVELNPNLAEAHFRYSGYLSIMGQHTEALAEVQRANEVDPLQDNLRIREAFTLFLARRYDEATEKQLNAIKLNPDAVGAHFDLGLTYAAKGMYEQGINELRKAISIRGETTSDQIYLGALYAKAGERVKAQEILKRLQTSNEYVSPGELAVLYAALGEREQAFASLEKAYTAHDLQLQYLGVDPLFDSLRTDPRFQDLLRKVGLSVNSN